MVKETQDKPAEWDTDGFPRWCISRSSIKETVFFIFCLAKGMMQILLYAAWALEADG